MKDRVFLDTNILIYLYSESEPVKREAACRLLNTAVCITSLQAMHEASNVWFKKYGWDGGRIREHLDNIELVCDAVIPVGRSEINTALSLKEQYGYSYYDSLMLASALETGCGQIITEDMRHGHVIMDRLKIMNPFSGIETGN